MKVIQQMDGAQQMGSMVLHHGEMYEVWTTSDLSDPTVFQIFLVDLRGEGSYQLPSWRRKLPETFMEKEVTSYLRVEGSYQLPS